MRVMSRLIFLTVAAALLMAMAAAPPAGADDSDPTAVIMGRLLDHAGQPFGPNAGVHVNVYGLPAEGAAWQLRTSTSPDLTGHFSAVFFPGANLCFALRFNASWAGGNQSAWYDLRASGEFADRLALTSGETLDIGEVRLASGRVHGIVSTASGAPVPGLTVRAFSTRDGTACARATTGADGAYDFPQVPTADGLQHIICVTDPAGAVATTYYAAAADAAAADRITVTHGADLRADVTVPDPTGYSITGRVADAFDNSAEGILVQALDTDAAVVGQAVTASDGTFAITGLAAGAYRIFFSDPAGLFDSRYWLSGTEFADAPAVPLNLEQRTYQALCTLRGGPNGVRLQGTVTAGGDPVAGIGVSASQPGDQHSRFTTTATDGTYRFGTLVPGTYRLYFTGSSVTPAQWYDQAFKEAEATHLELSAGGAYTVNPELATVRPSPSPSPTPSPTPTPTARPDGAVDSSAQLRAAATSLAADGDTAAAGETWQNRVSVFVRSDSGWALQQALTPPGTPDPGEYGQTVAVSGDTLAVSEFRDDGTAEAPGKVHVYTRSGETWTLQQTLAPAGAAYRSFGLSVALSGDTLLVGAPYVTIGKLRWAGCAYVFTRSGGTWSQRAQITRSQPAEDDFFGWALAVQGGTAVISANMVDTAARVNGGLAYVFAGSGSAWTQRATLRPSDGEDAQGFGDAVALDAGTAVVTCARAAGAGAAYVYTGAGGSWSQQARLTASSDQTGGDLGATVALAGDTILTTSAEDTLPGGHHARGTAYLFQRAGTDWHQRAALRAPYHGETPWRLGRAVAIGGGDALVGAPYEPDGAGWRGVVHAFHPYVTDIAQPLNVPARSGVLANDRAPQGETLTAELVSEPSHGSLDLRADGSFEYVPDAAWAGLDTFTYRATGGAWTSSPTTVTVTTRDPNAPTVWADDLPAGWTNTPVTLALAADDDTEVEAIDYRRQASAPGPWLTYGAPFTISDQGASRYTMRARDLFGNGSAHRQFTVRVDTRRPTAQAPRACTVVRGRTASIKYRIADPRPGSPTATVTIRVFKGPSQKLKATLKSRKVGTTLTYSFRCRLPKGKYTFRVTAVDAAGNATAKAAVNKLVVK